MSSTISVRFPVCYPSAPFLIPAMIYTTTLASTMLLRYILYATCEKAQGDEQRMREECSEGDFYDINLYQPSGEDEGEDGVKKTTHHSQKLWRRLLISFSESFVLWQCRAVLYTGCFLATVFGFVCFSDPIYACGVLVASVELALVGATPWSSYEHEISTFIFIVSLLSAQVAVCVVYLRVDTRYPFWIYGILVGISLLLSLLFGVHPLVVAYARTIPLSTSSSSSSSSTSSSKVRATRYCLAWFERERLSWMEVMLGSTLLATFILVGGNLSP